MRTPAIFLALAFLLPVTLTAAEVAAQPQPEQAAQPNGAAPQQQQAPAAPQQQEQPGQAAQPQQGQPGQNAQPQPGQPGQVAQPQPGQAGQVEQPQNGQAAQPQQGQPGQPQQGQPGQVAQPQPGQPAQGLVPYLTAEQYGQPGQPAMFRLTSGALVVIRGKEAATLERGVLFPNGSMLSPGGTLRRTDGTSTQLLDGQMVSAAGELGAAPANPDATAPAPAATGGSSAPLPITILPAAPK